MNMPVFHMLSDAPIPAAPYSHAVEIDGWLFLAGQIASDLEPDSLPEGIEAQTHKVMENPARVLAGGDDCHVPTPIFPLARWSGMATE